MSTLCGSVLLAFVAGLLAVFALSCNVEARQGFGGFFIPAPFWSGPYYEPPPWRERYYGAPRKHHYAPPRKRKIVRSERRKVTQSTTRRAALAVPNGAAKASPPISCEQAQAIVAEFGFKHIKADLCTGKNFAFHATRDGKPFSIEIEAANGELAKVQRLR